MLLFLLALAGGPNPELLKQPRSNLSACLKSFERSSVAAKMPPDDYAKAVRASCPSEAAALKKALVTFDVAMGTKRAAAEGTAQTDLDDYFLMSEEQYRAAAGPPK